MLNTLGVYVWEKVLSLVKGQVHLCSVLKSFKKTLFCLHKTKGLLIVMYTLSEFDLLN